MLSENRQPLLGRVRPRHLTANGELYGQPNGTPPDVLDLVRRINAAR